MTFTKQKIDKITRHHHLGYAVRIDQTYYYCHFVYFRVPVKNV